MAGADCHLPTAIRASPPYSNMSPIRLTAYSHGAG